MNNLENKKVLVTGGAGFIGSHLCDRLLSLGAKVICLDNLFTGSDENIRHLLDKDGFEFVNHDVEDPYDYEVDYIFNLACPASPIWYQKDPVKTVRTNVMGAINALDLAKKLNCRVLHTSTSEVYGDPHVHPQTEDYWGNVNPIGERSCYDEGKRCAETLFFDYHREYDVDIRVVRIFNTYGPRMAINDGRVVSNFIVQALNNQDITIYGDGEQIMDLIYVKDMVEILSRIILKDNIPNDIIYEAGVGGKMTINKAVDLVLEMTNSSSKVNKIDMRPGEEAGAIVEISEKGWDNLKKYIDYFPENITPMKEAIQKSIVWYKEHLSDFEWDE